MKRSFIFYFTRSRHGSRETVYYITKSATAILRNLSWTRPPSKVPLLRVKSLARVPEYL
jgi:hypothetical protein